jgi:hypothetical protein
MVQHGTHAGREMTPEQAACYLAAGLLLGYLKTTPDTGPLREQLQDIALRVEVERLRREMMRRSGELGYEERK